MKDRQLNKIQAEIRQHEAPVRFDLRKMERLPYREGLQICHLRPSDFDALLEGRLTAGMARAVEMVRAQGEVGE